MRRVLPLVLAVGATLASCRAADNISAPNDHRIGDPLRDVTGMNCNMDESKCDIIRAGIDYLLNHANGFCRSMGQAALDRFEAPAATGDGYEEASQVAGYNMGVVMEPGWGSSGYAPTSGQVDVYPSFWTSGFTDAQSTGALLAHEEQHQNGNDGIGDNTGYGPAAQQTCLNTSA